MFRYDDGIDDMMLGLIAIAFYFWAVIFLVGAIVMPYTPLVPLPFAIAGGVFHFMKVSTDGRVRLRDYERNRRERKVRDRNIPTHTDTEGNE